VPFKSISPTAKPKLSARARLHTDKVTGKPVLLYPEGALMLNPTAHAITLLCDGTKTLDSIVSNLGSRYEHSGDKIAIQVRTFLHRLRAKNLVELRDS
jgi:pyrroloquinoline quinone biosynthesis protein D